MGRKTPVNLSIDSEVVEAAKELGLNMSKIAESCPKAYIKRLTQP